MKQNRWFWPWQDEEEERWLIEQAKIGLMLASVHFPFTYVFQQDNTQCMAYRLDYFDPKKEGLRDFMNARNKDNWLFIGTMHGWHYFSKKISGDESMQDAGNYEAKKSNFYHMMNYLAGFFPIIIIWFPVLGRFFSRPLYDILAIFAVVVCTIFIWVSIKTYQRAIQLRNYKSKK